MNFVFQWKLFSMINLNVFSYFDNITGYQMKLEQKDIILCIYHMKTTGENKFFFIDSLLLTSFGG